jgi:uncharacterized membrane protein
MSTFNLNNFNDLIKNANSVLSCGPDCVEQKTASDLKQKYLTAQTNEKTAQYQVSDAAKNYLTFTQGESGYNEYLDNDLGNKATSITNNYNTNFNNTINIIKDKINTFNSLFLNVKNVSDLYKKYKDENDFLENKLQNKSADIITNDRKTYYEEEGISKLKNYYYFFILIYIIILVIFTLACIFVNTTVSVFIRFIVLLILICYPFILFYVFESLKKMTHRIKDFIPSYAYRNI